MRRSNLLQRTAFVASVVALWASCGPDIGMEETDRATGIVEAALSMTSVWETEAELYASDAGQYDYFGSGLAMYGSTLVVGASGADPPGLIGGAGAAYVFEVDAAGVWTEEQYILPLGLPAPSDSVVADAFGTSVQLNSEFLVISAPGNTIYGHPNCNYLCTKAGSLHIFRYLTGQWTEVGSITAFDANDISYFGQSLDMEGRRLIAGAPNHDYATNINTQEGAAYVYELDAAGQPTCEARLDSDDPSPYEHFGRSVAISGDYAIVGEPSQSALGSYAGGQGAAHIFHRTGPCSWTHEEELLASDGAALDRFGRRVAISGDVAVVGATAHDGRGAAYIFRRSTPGVWVEEDKLMSPTDSLAGNVLGTPAFGSAIEIDDQQVIVGELDVDAPTADSGAVHIFRRLSSGVWEHQTRIVAWTQAVQDDLGNALTINGDRLVVGARGDRDNGLSAGSVHVFLPCEGVLDDCAVCNGFNQDKDCAGVCFGSASDDDSDGVCDNIDICPGGDDNVDADNDNVPDFCDNCPLDPDKTEPGICGCGEPDVDTDNDGALDCSEDCPADPNKTVPGICGCGILDADSDGDGSLDCDDVCPNDIDNDIDNDGICGNVDNCPSVGNTDQSNTDGDTFGDICDPCANDYYNDVDGDSVCGDVDNCPSLANTLQEDADGDGQGDVCDACPNATVDCVGRNVVDLGTLGGAQSDAFGINEAGQIVGVADRLAPLPRHAVMWEGGVLTDLQPVGSGYEDVVGTAYAINDSTPLQIVGALIGGGTTEAAFWDNGAITLEPPAIQSVYRDINDAGHYVGYVNSSGPKQAVFDGASIAFSLPVSSSEATAINNAGLVVGWQENGGATIGFLYDSVLATDSFFRMYGYGTHPLDINEAGDIVGYYEEPGDCFLDYCRKAFLWDWSTDVQLGTLGRFSPSESQPNAINDSRQVVGESDGHAFIWVDGVMTDLNDLQMPDSAWTLVTARDINNAGEIVGRGIVDGEWHAFLMEVDCRVDVDCDDGNSCTDDVCSAGLCEYTDNTDPCDDGDACNWGETCAAGVCSGGSAVSCVGTGSECLADSTCDPSGAEGNCALPGSAINDGGSCGNQSDSDCDNPDTCLNGACLPNIEPAGTLCRLGSGDVCDPDERCDGSSSTCPADVVEPATTVCNAGTGDLCDPDELCTGNSGEACPADTVAPESTICRTGSGDLCDPDEQCTGEADEPCPADLIQPASTVCNAGSGDLCDPDELCSGVAGEACPDDTVEPASTICRSGSDDICDPDELCTGVADETCPEDFVEPATTECREDAGECDVPETCDGAGSCPADGYEPLGTACGDSSSGECDESDSCDGAGNCDDNTADDSTPCNDDDLCATEDVCAAGICIGMVCEPNALINPTAHDFGDVPVGESAPATLTITNDGANYLNVFDVSLAPGGDVGVIDIVALEELQDALPIRLSPDSVDPPTATLDVNLTFTPTALLFYSATLVILTDDPDTPSTSVVFVGVGVSADGDPEQVISEVLEFIEVTVEAGSLAGDGPGRSAANRLNALVNMIEAAGDLFEAGLVGDACSQLLDAYRRTDGVPRPPDFVTGEDRANLASLIEDAFNTFCH